MKVIGFTGPAGAGKDTAARMLAEHLESHGLRVRVQAWADKLKVMAARSLGYPATASDQDCIDFCDNLKVDGVIRVSRPSEDNKRIWEISGREYLEFMGTEGGREVLGQDVWINAALPSPNIAPLWRAQHGFPNVVIDTTTRFPNEVARIREWGGKIIRIERGEYRAPETGHASRAGIPADECDAVILNEGSLAELESAVIAVFHNLETMPV